MKTYDLFLAKNAPKDRFLMRASMMVISTYLDLHHDATARAVRETAVPGGACQLHVNRGLKAGITYIVQEAVGYLGPSGEFIQDDVPFNPALHAHLTSLGYVRSRHEASWEDVGDAENGPELDGGPAYDEYTGPDEYVFTSESGVLDREPRDLAFEKWVEDHQ